MFTIHHAFFALTLGGLRQLLRIHVSAHPYHWYSPYFRVQCVHVLYNVYNEKY